MFNSSRNRPFSVGDIVRYTKDNDRESCLQSDFLYEVAFVDYNGDIATKNCPKLNPNCQCLARVGKARWNRGVFELVTKFDQKNFTKEEIESAVPIDSKKLQDAEEFFK